MKYKLIISNVVAFDFFFTLNVSGEEKEYGLRLEGVRVEQPTVESGVTVGEFLDQHANVHAVRWLTDCPIGDEDGEPVPAADALLAIYDLWPEYPGLVLRAYLDATRARAKLGNSPG